MGGGDLNLKKSWHPSTMKNMEKVWKAEQQKNQEKKRIAELKKEIEMEKDREDLTKYAMDQGVIEKKDDKKLDWMYKGPNQMVNREDYLLGKPIDKPFEQMAQQEKDIEMNRAPKNHVEHECIPPSLRFFSGNEQVDLARKMQEDPLYAIKKKEMETRSQLLKNPVKLKQLRQLLEEQSKKSKIEKKRKKKKKRKNDTESDDETELDVLLATKYKQLKDKMTDKDFIKSMKHAKHKRKKKFKKDSDDSESESDSSSEESSNDDSASKKKKKPEKSDENVARQSKYGTEKYEVESRKESGKRDAHEKHFREHSPNWKRSNERANRTHSKDNDFRSRSPRYREDGGYKSADRNTGRDRYFSQKSDRSQKSYARSPDAKRREEKDRQKWNPKKQQLTEEEKERRRQEMMANASWRNKEREKNVKQYREEEKKEINSGKSFNQDFIRKQLAAAAEIGTVASRIKSNINNIQRSGRAMDTNFAKR